MSQTVVFSPAKINLSLKILGRRDDGYHEIDSIFAKLNFGDELTFEDKTEGIEIRATGDYKIPTNAENLVYKAAQLMRERAKGKRGIRISIHKKIPIGAGMGGGSSNAAMTLKFLNKHWEVNLPREKLEELGKNLGADVIFFLQEEPMARVQGIGDQIVPLCHSREGGNLGHGMFAKGEHNILLDPRVKPEDDKYQVLFIIPKYISISTPWAYQKLVEYYKGDYKKPSFEKGVGGLGFRNSFEEPIFQIYPDLKNIKKTLQDAGASQAAMTGSGAVVFGVFNKEKNLSEVQNLLSQKGECIISSFL